MPGHRHLRLGPCKHTPVSQLCYVPRLHGYAHVYIENSTTKSSSYLQSQLQLPAGAYALAIEQLDRAHSLLMISVVHKSHSPTCGDSIRVVIDTMPTLCRCPYNVHLFLITVNQSQRTCRCELDRSSRAQVAAGSVGLEAHYERHMHITAAAAVEVPIPAPHALAAATDGISHHFARLHL